MIYMKGSDLTIIVLESANLEELKNGHPAKSPDGKVLIAWTADPVWLADKIMDSGGDAHLIGKLIDEAAKRPEKPSRPYHKPHQTTLTPKPEQEP